MILLVDLAIWKFSRNLCMYCQIFYNAADLCKVEDYWRRTKAIQGTPMPTVGLAVEGIATQGL